MSLALLLRKAKLHAQLKQSEVLRLKHSIACGCVCGILRLCTSTCAYACESEKRRKVNSEHK
eukprot:5954338-Pleurochrysis_carterae.AAC.1